MSTERRKREREKPKVERGGTALRSHQEKKYYSKKRKKNWQKQVVDRQELKFTSKKRFSAGTLAIAGFGGLQVDASIGIF